MGLALSSLNPVRSSRRDRLPGGVLHEEISAAIKGDPANLQYVMRCKHIPEKTQEDVLDRACKAERHLSLMNRLKIWGSAITAGLFGLFAYSINDSLQDTSFYSAICYLYNTCTVKQIISWGERMFMRDLSKRLSPGQSADATAPREIEAKSMPSPSER
jgi:hypothetical protein